MVVSGKMKSERSFPRGKPDKGSKKNSDHLMTNTVTRTKDRDLFSTSSDHHKDKSHVKKDKQKKKDKAWKKKGASDKEFVLSVQTAENLSYQKLSEGMPILAAISDIQDYEMKLSLPGRLVATVPITNISKQYTDIIQKLAENPDDVDVSSLKSLKDMFSIGQLVMCSIASVDKTEEAFYKVTASLKPQDIQGSLKVSNIKQGSILTAAVESVEDHGFIMDVGISGTKAFVTKKKMARYVADILDGSAVGVGQLIPCFVSEVKPGALTLSPDPKKVRSSVVKTTDLSVHTMLPGMNFEVTVETSIANGIKVKFADFVGYIHKDHLRVANEDPDTYEDNSTLEARLLYILPTVNTIYLSLRDNHRFGDKPTNPFERHKIGDLVKDAHIVSSGQSGVTLKLNDDGDVGYVSARHVSENKEVPKDIKTKFPIGSTANCRIFQYDFIDRVFICSMQKSLLSQRMLKINELEHGEKVKCKVKRFVPKGMIVEVGKSIEGFVPAHHISDVPLKHPEKKFSVGDKLTCRVLRVDCSSEKRKLHLTNKSILVNEEYPVVASFSPDHIGVVTEGVVVKIKKDGLLLQLFGEVRGWVPKSKVSVEEVEYLEKLFFFGQALKCQVVDVEPAKQRMTLSLIIGGTSKPLGKREKQAGDSIKLGSVHDCKVADVSDDGLAVEVTSKDDHVIKAFIPKHHLTDHPFLADDLLRSFSVGETIKDALCFERDVMPIFTIKPFILESAKDTRIKSYSDLHEGAVLPGVVCLIKNYGVFLRLPTWKFRKSALVPMRHLADQFVEDPNEMLSLHQTVFGKVLEKNDDQQKITMSTKVKDVAESNTEHSVELLASYFRDMKRIHDHVLDENLSCYHPGMPATCSVRTVSEFGVIADVGGATGVITHSNLAGLGKKKKFAVGDQLSVVVLFVDHQAKCMELSAQPDIVKKATMAGKKEPKVGAVVKAIAALIRTEFSFVTLCIKSPPHLAGHLVHVPTRHHINDPVGFADLFSLGEIYSVIIKKNVDGATIGVLEKHERKAERGTKRHRTSSMSSDDHGKKKTEDEAVELKRIRQESESANEEKVEAKEEKMEVETPKRNDPGWEENYNPFGESVPVPTNKADDATTANSPTKAGKLKTHLSKKEKKELDKLEAEEIARAEQRVLDGEEAAPETVDEFERLVLASPDSSLCWIKYMAFHMEKKEFEKARAVAKRALERINFREEAERLNVFIAWFNLENSLDDEEQTEKLLKEALRCNDEYKVYKQVAAIYTQSGKFDKAEKMYKAMAKKFSKEVDVWVKFGLHYFKQKNLKEARFILQRSIQNLEKKHHVDITAKFAQLEFKFGEAERGKNIFETILGNYPKRTDLWSVYVDMVIKAGEYDAAREIFERMITLSLQPKKMKVLFKKYLQFEEEHGDEGRVDEVRKKALEYVESKVGVSITEAEEAMDVE